MLRKLLSHAAIYALAAQIPRVAGILALPIITPHLTSADYGVAGVVTAYVSALGVVQSLGLSVVMANAFVKYPTRYKWVWRQIGGIVTLWSVIYGFLLGFALYYILPEEAFGNRWTIILLNLVPALFFNHTTFQGGFLYYLKQKPFPVALHTFIIGAILVVLNVYFIAFMNLGYMGWFYSSFIGAALSFAYYLYPIYFIEGLWPIFLFKKRRVSALLKVGLPAIPHHVSYILLDASDKIVMDAVRVPIRNIGAYNIASSFGLYFSAAAQAIVYSASPLYLKLYAKEEGLVRNMEVRSLTHILQLLFLAATSVLSLWMKEIFELLIKNDTLQQAYPLAIIILMGYNYIPMHLAAVQWLSFNQKTQNLWKISLVASIGNIVLNLIFVPVFGVKAAAYSTFLTLMYMGYSGFYLKSFRQENSVPFYPLTWLAITVLLLIVVYFFVEFSVNMKLLVTLLIGTTYAFISWFMVKQLKY
ncbi:lipopolysaccharide biosynthesis protein [Pontibacter oryzae]|uniref:Lipopolysaccharide biosynthesis protein n=1 Tax=Pontibacter oryzae TaxID=2304593 RepID=A0A399S365_9BACT|nr:lipopolysaccharide biosynthesis protein [Pontibacter oryzae]RIJ36889.1 lipopolysaccharide biosynthesis protein [Pontibacter oryzae]